MTISLAFLAPDLVKAAIDGRLPHGMGVARLCDLPAEWSRQPPDAGPHLSAIVEPVSTYDVSVAGKPPARSQLPFKEQNLGWGGHSSCARAGGARCVSTAWVRSPAFDEMRHAL
jgi:hypothetical protein